MSDAASIFISYRRQEANWLAALLHDRLAAHFGEFRVFLDIDWIKPGVDFMQVITEAIGRSGILLVIIGPQWLTLDGDGHRRLEQPNDPVRVEIETAFHQDIPVIPLLLEGATMPRAEDLPDGLTGLARLNALPVGYQSFRSDVVRLVETIAEELGTAPSPGFAAAGTAVEPGLNPEPTRVTGRVASVTAGQDAEQRARLLGRLWRTYVEYLNQSVEHDAILKLQLDLDWLPDRTVRPQDRLLAAPGRRAERLPAGTSLLQVFDRTGGLGGDGFLLLGEPGAGKTTLLFELARQLTERAQADPRHPMPVYLPLSSWAARRPRLEEWIVEQLDELYQIPRPLGRRWAGDGQLLFLLDGLDEIPDRTDRIACIKAINRFNRFGHSYRLPMVVASRPLEYDTLPMKLQLETGIAARPLEAAVVLDALQHAGPGMQAVVAALRRDPEQLNLLRSPLLVSMLTLAYTGFNETQINALTGTSAQRRHQLIADYVNRRFQLDRLSTRSDRTPTNAYPPKDTRAWLSVLARNLARHQQTVFLLGRLQPDWLQGRWARGLVVATPGLLIAVIVGPLVGLLLGWNLGSLVGVSVGLGAGLAGFIGQTDFIAHLSGSRTRARLWLWIGLIAGPVTALSVGLAAGLGVFGGTGGIGAGLLAGLAAGVTVGAAAGGLVYWVLGWPAGLIVSLIGGLVAGTTISLIVGLTTGDIYSASSAGVFALAFACLAAGLARPAEPAERLSWSWRRAWAKRQIALVTLGATLPYLLFIYAVLTAVNMAPFGGVGGMPGLRTEQILAPLVLWLVGVLIRGLIGGFSKSDLPVHVAPNEGIRRSIQHGLIVAMTVGLGIGMSTGLVNNAVYGLSAGLTSGLLVGLIIGLSSGLPYGLAAAAQHGTLRLLMYMQHTAPLRYVRWLDHAVHLRLLYRGTSGGYMFIHRMVQDHFCEVASTHLGQGPS